MVHSCDTSRVRARVCARARESGIVARLSTRQKRSKPTRGRRHESRRRRSGRSQLREGAPRARAVRRARRASRRVTTRPPRSRRTAARRAAPARASKIADSQNLGRNHIINLIRRRNRLTEQQKKSNAPARRGSVRSERVVRERARRKRVGEEGGASREERRRDRREIVARGAGESPRARCRWVIRSSPQWTTTRTVLIARRLRAKDA